MLNGLLLVNKSRGFTSHDVVAKLRGILRQRKIGHAGTLDPMAEGLLVVLLGSATRASEYAAASYKEYQAEFKLGVITDTQDTSGKILETHPVDCAEDEVRAAIASFEGGYEQMPPMYSAIQKNGMRLYDLAREGREIERDARFIDLTHLALTGRGPDGAYQMTVACSKGTYIRTLCHDIGQKLGCGAAMSALTRTKIGQFDLKSAHTLEEIAALQENDALAPFLLPVELVFSEYPAVTLNEEGRTRALNGAPLIQKHLTGGSLPPEEALCRVYDHQGEFLMLGRGGRLDIGLPAIFCHKIFAI
ncbi:tRNA pseudouridine(55) synthase TruB [Acidaminobacterium chupaoyuni]